MEDYKLIKWEAILLVKDFTSEHAQDEVEFSMGMVAEEDQTLSGKTVNDLTGEFYGVAQKSMEIKDAFTN